MLKVYEYIIEFKKANNGKEQGAHKNIDKAGELC
jgi:hypothetical protein